VEQPADEPADRKLENQLESQEDEDCPSAPCSDSEGKKIKLINRVLTIAAGTGASGLKPTLG
jgi:hypothetical protein